MHFKKEIADKLYYIGVNDRRLELFENMFPIPNGVSYNSYVLLDEKTVLFDTVDKSALCQFKENLNFTLENRNLDYLIINHMEPDHAACLKEIIAIHPDVTVVGNAKTFNMMKQFLGCEFNSLVVKEGDVLETGEHKLTFVMAPMVHWPEVMVTYDLTSKVLFSADAFGTFGALDGRVFADEYDYEKDILPEARRYFTNIVGKYGAQALAVLEKAKKLEISMVCSLHGPIWRNDDIVKFLEAQATWSSYTPESPDEIFIAYASMYGNTESVVDAVSFKLSEQGKKVKVINICNTDKSYLIAEAFRCGNILLACPTYNGGIYPVMESFVLDMKALNLRNRNIFIIENGSWAPTVGRKIKEITDTMKNMETKAVLTIKSSLFDEGAIDNFVAEF